MLRNKSPSSFGSKILFIVVWVAISGFASWWIAFFWSKHGDQWLAMLPDFINRGAYALCRVFLSRDAAEAEDQLQFLLFWIPSFVVVGAVTFFVMKIPGSARNTSSRAKRPPAA